MADHGTISVYPWPSYLYTGVYDLSDIPLPYGSQGVQIPELNSYITTGNYSIAGTIMPVIPPPTEEYTPPDNGQMYPRGMR